MFSIKPLNPKFSMGDTAKGGNTETQSFVLGAEHANAPTSTHYEL